LTEVASAIRDKRTSSVEVTEACLARIETHQPALNCFITIEADDVLNAAKAADEKLASDPAGCGPLHGVPLAHKDMFYRAGKICTCGSEIRRHWRPDYTATIIERLEAAGALQVGTLNMIEFAAGSTGHNEHYGDCLNPWNIEYSPGASSSGSGSSVAARLVYGAMGSDTGGSVRLPAMQCGLVGLKPGYGRISRYGAMPRSYATDSMGPLTRTVRDCARMTGIIAGHDPRDGYTAQIDVPDYEAHLKDSVRGMRIGIPTSYFYDAVDEEMQAAVMASLDIFSELGAEIVEVDIPDLEQIYELAQVGLKAEASAIHEEWLRTRPQDYSDGIRGELESGLLIPAVRYLESHRMREPTMVQFVEQVFGKVDVLHAPVSEQPAPKMADVSPHNAERAAELMHRCARLTRPVGYMGLPALAVPCGFSGIGLPLGFQLIGRPFSEARLFTLGHAYQDETGWHEQAPPI
jgi:aspartyl-tRNA(Asn)/glutamyl-tRNA(Gln) amidotransferase subunit A